MTIAGAARPLLQVVIKRSTWLRGEGSAASKLLRSSDGKKCCVGDMCLAAGVPADRLLDVSRVGFDAGFEKLPTLEGYMPLYIINDCPTGTCLGSASREYAERHFQDIADIPMTDALRESEIIARAKPLGYDVRFED